MKFRNANICGTVLLGLSAVLRPDEAAAQSAAAPSAEAPCEPAAAGQTCPSGQSPTVQAAGARSGGTDNAPVVSAIMNLLGPGPAGGQGYSVLFPQDPAKRVTQYYFSAPLTLSRSGTVRCDGGAGFRTHSVHLVFAAGQDGVVWDNAAHDGGYSQAELQGCAIITLGAGKAQSVTPGSGVISGITMIGDESIAAPFFAAGDGIIVSPSSGNATPTNPVSVPNGATVGSVNGSSVTLAGGATVSAGGLTPAYVYRLPAVLAGRATVVNGSATVTITGGSTRFYSGDMVWIAGFPFGTRILTANGPTGAQTLVMDNIFLTANQPASASLSGTQIWRVPAGLRRRQQGYSRANYVFGFPVSIDLPCSSAGGLNCVVSNDELNGFEYGVIGRATAGNNTGGSKSEANEYVNFMLADILEGGTIGSTYVSENSNSGSRSSAWPVIGNCVNQNYSVFVGGYIDNGFGGWDYCMNGPGTPPQFLSPVAGAPFDATTNVSSTFVQPNSGAGNIAPYSFTSTLTSSVASASYDKATGLMSITTRQPLNVAAGQRFFLYGVTGADNANFGLSGVQTATTGSGGSTITFAAKPGHAWTITSGIVSLRDNMPCVNLSGSWYSLAVSKDCATPNMIGLQYQPATDAWVWVGATNTPLFGMTGPKAARPWLPFVPRGSLLLGDQTDGRVLSFGAAPPADGSIGDVRFNSNPTGPASPLGWRKGSSGWTPFYGSTSGDGGGTASFAVGSAAGAGATASCAPSHVCDSQSGTVALTLGKGTSAGSLLTITFPRTRTNQPNCALSGVNGGEVGPTYTTSSMTLTASAAQKPNAVLTIGYFCGGD